MQIRSRNPKNDLTKTLIQKFENEMEIESEN